MEATDNEKGGGRVLNKNLGKKVGINYADDTLCFLIFDA